MAKSLSVAGIVLTIVTTVPITWSRFASSTYPFTIAQPSSYRHVVLRDTSDRLVDYFFPSLGSFTTNVNVYAFPGTVAPDEAQYLRSIGGQNVHHLPGIYLAGARRDMVQANFRGIPGQWVIIQTAFPAQGLIWRLTASYDLRYQKLRPILMRMLRSFQLAGSTRQRPKR